MITVETIPYLGYAMVFYKHRSAYTDMCAHEAEASGMLLCAKYDGTFAGFICVTSNSREDRITYAFTIPEFRRKGVFSALALYVMENGEIAESGNHNRLMAQNGVYSNLWKTQSLLENYGKEAE